MLRGAFLSCVKSWPRLRAPGRVAAPLSRLALALPLVLGLLSAAFVAVAATAGPAHATLSALVPGTGLLTPAFSPDTTDYLIAVPAGTGSIVLTPTAAGDGATITVNGSPVASGTAWHSGSLTDVTIVVTDEGGGSTTYALAVVAMPSPAPGALPEGAVGVNYTARFTGMEHQITTGTPPPGLSFYTIGSRVIFGGIPERAGTYTFGIRITDFGSGRTGTYTYSLTITGGSASTDAADIDRLVRGFVQTRQSLVAAAVRVPGLAERRQAGAATDPAAARLSPSGDGLALGFSTSLARMRAAAAALEGVAAAGAAPAPFDLWVDATLMIHGRDDNGSRRGNFAMVSAGADYFLGEKALVGLSFHYDRMTDPTDPDARLAGNGWLLGPYASLEIGSGVFWNAHLLYGGSSNAVDTAFWDGAFDTRRWLFDTSLTGQWRLDAATVLTPRLRAVYLSETVKDYRLENAGGDVLAIGGFTAEQLRVSLGAEVVRRLALENGSTLTPSLGVTGGFSGLDGAGAFGAITAGLSYRSPAAWTVDGGLLFTIEGGGRTALGAKIGVGISF